MSSSKEIRKAIEDKLKAKERLKEKKERKNYEEVILFCNYLGDLYFKQGEYDEAIEQHVDELKYARESGHSPSIALANRKLGECYCELGDFESALRFHNEYLRIVRSLEDRAETQRAYATLGRTHFMRYTADAKKNAKSLEEAEKSHRKALDLAKRLKGQLRDGDELKERDCYEMQCRALLNLGLVFEAKNEEECSAYFRDAIKLASAFSFKEDLHRCQLSLAAFYSKVGNHAEAIRIYNSALENSKKLDKLDLLETLMGKALTLLQQRDYENAKHCFKKAYFVYKFDCDENYEAKRCCSLVKRIIIRIRELTNLKECSDSTAQKIKTCDELGDLFCELNCYSVALEYYHRELSLATAENYHDSKLAPIYSSLGQTYLDNKQYIESLVYFEKEIKCHEGDPRKLKEIIKTSFRVIEARFALYANDNEISREYERLIGLCGEDGRLKRLVYEEYLSFLKEIDDCDLYSEKIKQISAKLDSLDGQGDSQSTQSSQSNEEAVLSEISDLTSDSETEENEELNGRRRRTKKDSDKRNEKGETKLHRACIEGDLKKVKELIKNGCSINPRDNCGWLPIHEASNHGHAEIVEALLKHGALKNDPGGRGCDGITPLHDACSNGHYEVINLLLNFDANVACVDYHDNSPLDCLNQYLNDQGAELREDERRRFQELASRIREKMEQKGFKKEKKTLKRPFSSIDRLGSDSNQHLLEDLANKIDKNKLKRSRALADSPPRKTNRLDSQQSHSSSSSLRKNTDHSSDQPSNRPAPRINSLINEDDLIVDDWLDDDIGLNRKKSKAFSDPFAQKRSHLTENSYKSPVKPKSPAKQKSSASRSSTQSPGKRKSASPVVIEENSSVNCYFDSDIEMDDNRLQASDSPLNDALEENSNSSDSLPVLVSQKSGNRKVRRRQTKIKSYFNSDAQTMKSAGDGRRDDVILVSNSVSRTSQQPAKAACKLKVHVHIDGMTLLVPVPNENASIGWLSNETIERYYSFKKIRPVVQLKTMDGALLSNDDQIVDVLTTMEVQVEIDSFNIKPIDELYGELCRLANLRTVNELDYEFRISMASGCLNLRNCFLDQPQFRLVTDSLKMQSKIKALDLSYSNLLKMDDSNFSLLRTIFGLENLEVLNLECTGLSRQQLAEIAKHRSAKLMNLNLNYNLLLNCDDLICELLEGHTNLRKLFLQYTDLTGQLILNLRLNQLIEKRPNRIEIHIDTLKNSKNCTSSSFVASYLDVPEANELDHLEFSRQLFI